MFLQLKRIAYTYNAPRIFYYLYSCRVDGVVLMTWALNESLQVMSVITFEYVTTVTHDDLLSDSLD